MTDFALDLRHALRALKKHATFTAVAVLTLSLAIAATTTVVAVVDAAIIRPLPFPDADRLVQIVRRTPEGSDFTSSEPDYLDFARDTRTFASIGALKPATATLIVGDIPRRIHAFAVSQSFFPTIGERHFQHWLGLFYATLRDVAPSEGAVALAGARARMIAESLLTGIAVHRDRDPDITRRMVLPHV